MTYSRAPCFDIFAEENDRLLLHKICLKRHLHRPHKRTAWLTKKDDYMDDNMGKIAPQKSLPNFTQQNI